MKLVVGLAVTLLSGSALAQEPAPAAPEPEARSQDETRQPEERRTSGATSDVPGESRSAEETWNLAMVQVPWTEPAGRGFGIGLCNGSWGGRSVHSLRFHIPFALWGAVVVRGIAVGDPGEDGWDLGGRLEFRGQGPVYLNFVRLYGGGGMQVMTTVSGAKKAKAEVGGGGYFGFEFFNARWLSLFIEIGAQGGGPASGPTIMAGVQAYPF